MGVEPPTLQDFRISPQRLIYALLPGDQIDGDSIRVPITIGVTARSQNTRISEVRFVVQAGSTIEAPLKSGLLSPGRSNRFESVVTLTLDALNLATYTVLVYAVDASGSFSGDVRGSLYYFRSFEPGTPPVIVSLDVPDRIERPDQGDPAVSLPLIAEVSDEDGASDVATVEFWNVNTPSVRFLMCDDGSATLCGTSQNSGDQVANDGLYTRTVFVTSDNAVGTTTLGFQVTDRAGLQSDVLTHDIMIE